MIKKDTYSCTLSLSKKTKKLTSCVALKGAFCTSVVASPEQSAIFLERKQTTNSLSIICLSSLAKWIEVHHAQLRIVIDMLAQLCKTYDPIGRHYSITSC